MMGRLHVSRLGVVVLVVALASCRSTNPDPRDASRVFRAVIADPIPAHIENLASTGYITESGHNLYLRFTIDPGYLPELLDLYEYEPIACTDEQFQGRLTLPQGLEDDIPGWRPFNGDNYDCYESRVGYRNEWVTAGNSVILVRRNPVAVFFNETGASTP